MSSKGGPPGSLIRARNQVAVVGIFDAVWTAFALFSLWFCRAVGSPFAHPALLVLLAPHIALAVWGVLLLCAPNLYVTVGILIFGAITSILSGILLPIIVSDVTLCFPGCTPCLYWFTLIFAGYTIVALIWTVLTYRYAAQASEEETLGETAQQRDNGGDEGSEERGAFFANTLQTNTDISGVRQSLRQRNPRKNWL